MHRIASVAVIAVTAYFLIATSQAPCSATPETVAVTSRGTCGPDTPVTVTVDARCQVTLDTPNAGLPVTGSGGSRSTPGSLVRQQVNLYQFSRPDGGGENRQCTLMPNDAGTGWNVTCDLEVDGGAATCEGTLSP